MSHIAKQLNAHTAKAYGHDWAKIVVAVTSENSFDTAADHLLDQDRRIRLRHRCAQFTGATVHIFRRRDAEFNQPQFGLVFSIGWQCFDRERITEIRANLAVRNAPASGRDATPVAA